jgi:ribosomal protein S15P/S13E
MNTVNYFLNKYRNTHYERTYTERDLRMMLGMYDLNQRIDNLRKGIEEYKKDFAVYYENLQKLNQKVSEYNTKYLL